MSDSALSVKPSKDALFKGREAAENRQAEAPAGETPFARILDGEASGEERYPRPGRVDVPGCAQRKAFAGCGHRLPQRDSSDGPQEVDSSAVGHAVLDLTPDADVDRSTDSDPSDRSVEAADPVQAGSAKESAIGAVDHPQAALNSIPGEKLPIGGRSTVSASQSGFVESRRALQTTSTGKDTGGQVALRDDSLALTGEEDTAEVRIARPAAFEEGRERAFAEAARMRLLSHKSETARLDATVETKGNPGAVETSTPSTLSADLAQPASQNPRAVAGSPLPGGTSQMMSAVSRDDWADELGNRVLWQINRNTSTAELKLNPPELGNMEVRIAVDKDATSISFVVQNPAAKDAVEGALSRLRELFNDAGLSLQQVAVEEHAAREHGDHARAGQSGSEQENAGGLDVQREDASGPSAAVRPSGASNRLVDAYA